MNGTSTSTCKKASQKPIFEIAVCLFVCLFVCSLSPPFFIGGNHSELGLFSMRAPGLAVLRHCGAEGHVEGEKKTDKKLPFNA